jgi:membrane-bound serine protease (ClpP class)
MRVVQGPCLTLGVLLLAAALAVPAMGQGKLVYVSVMDTEFIGEPTVRQVEEDLRKATDDGAYALVLLIDTPGGLFDSMNDVIQLIFSSSIPVVTFVAPKGADAASAGTFVTMAGHVAAMAPGTSTGAAQPVQYDPFGQGVPASNKTQSYIETKVRSYAEWTGRPMNVSLAFITTNLVLTPKQALDAGVIDLIAEDVEDLVSKVVDAPVHGRLPDGRERISLAGAEVKYLGKSLQDRFTNFMSHPTLAYLLFIVGIYGIIFGFTTPGSRSPRSWGPYAFFLRSTGWASSAHPSWACSWYASGSCSSLQRRPPRDSGCSPPPA